MTTGLGSALVNPLIRFSAGIAVGGLTPQVGLIPDAIAPTSALMAPVARTPFPFEH